MSLLKEFKEFAMKGNVVDMAVGVIIATAFGKIIDSLVKNVIMPTIALFGEVKVDNLWVVKEKILLGAFVQTIIDFLIVAICLFIAIKIMNSIMKKKAAEPAAPPPTPEDIQLLREIRDSLAKAAPRRAD